MKRPWREKVLDALRSQPPLHIVPKGRASGPRLVVDPLPAPVFGPRCRECRLPVFAGTATLHEGTGLCGPCARDTRGAPMPELRPYGDQSNDGPDKAA